MIFSVRNWRTCLGIFTLENLNRLIKVINPSNAPHLNRRMSPESFTLRIRVIRVIRGFYSKG